MKILSRHILSEFATPFASCMLILLVLFLAGRGLIQMADFIFNKSVDPLLILKLLFFVMPFLLTFIIPMSVLVASLLTFGKLSADNEIVAAQASGVNLLKTLGPLFALVLVLSLCSFILSDKIASFSHYTYRRVLSQIGIENPAAALEEGTFNKKFKNFIIFVYQIDKNKLKGIRIYQPQEGKPTRTIIAQKGTLISIPEKNIIKLKLVQGVSDEPDPKDPTRLYKLNFKTYDLPLNVSEMRDMQELGKKPKDMSIKELRDEIERLGEDGIRMTYPLSAEIHNKIALSLSSLAFLLIGVPLGISTRRSDRALNFGISAILMTFYWILLIGGKALAQRGIAPPLLSLEFSNFAAFATGAFLFWRLLRT